MKILKSKKWIVIFSVIIVLIVAFVLFMSLGVYRSYNTNDEDWLRYRGDKLICVGDSLFWSVDPCEPIGVVYVGGMFTTGYGQSRDAIYHTYPLFGGLRNTPSPIYVSEHIDCDVKNNIFDSVSLTDKSGNATLYDLNAPISAYAFCVTYSGPELRIKELTKVGTISLNHAEIDWLHLKYTVYCDAENYYCYKPNGVSEDGKEKVIEQWLVITDDSLIEWFADQQP